jgi:hypothetical protein
MELVAREIDSVRVHIRWNKGGSKSAGLFDWCGWEDNIKMDVTGLG